MKLFIAHNYRDGRLAGNKAKADIEQIMTDTGFQNAGIDQSRTRRGVANFISNLTGVLKAVTRIRRGDIVMLQYPLKKYFTFVCRMAHARGAKTATVIHDLGSCRRKALSVEKEIQRLGNADYVIASNEVMRQYLVDNGLQSATGALMLFDYLGNEQAPERKAPGHMPRVAYAGKISKRKNSFIWKWGPAIDGYEVDLYGDGFTRAEAQAPEAITEHGFTAPDKFISKCQSHYGLVWDGDSLDTCSGDWGEYLALNSPHKASFYLRAGLPLIVWKGSALADYVAETGIGIPIDSLHELAARLRQITPAQYDQMAQNVARVNSDIASGRYFARAFAKAEAYLDR